MGDTTGFGMGAAPLFFGPSGWLRPARPGEGPGLVWESAASFAPPPEPLPRLPEFPILPLSDLMAAWLTAGAAARGPASQGLPPGMRPVEFAAMPVPGEALPMPGDIPPRPPIAAEPLFPPPVLAGGAVREIAVPDGAAGIVHRPEVTDRPSEGLGWRITGGADAALLLMDPAAGTLEFLAPPDAARPDDADGDNRYEVVFEVRDGWGAAATQRLLLAVTDAVWG